MLNNKNRLGLLVCLALATCATCGGGAVQTTKPAVITPVKPGVVVSPLKVKKPKHVALILGTDDKGGSTEILLAGKRNTVRVYPMAVVTGGGRPARGTISEMTVTTAPNSDGEVHVGVFQQHSGGVGPQQRATVFIASLLAATALSKDLTDFTFSIDRREFVDGASSGALMTVGFLASMTNTKLLPNATMTGAVNPDGSIGPVGGIPHKFAGAIAKGKTRLGFPVGQRHAYDMNKHKRVDLVALAKSKGAVAREITDIWDAFEFLTGKKLPQPVPIRPREMKIDDEVDKQLVKYYKLWEENYTHENKALLVLLRSGKLKGLTQLYAMGKRASREAVEARKLFGQGLIVSAYDKMIQAVTYASTATATWAVLDKVRKGDAAGASRELYEFMALANATERALRKVGDLTPSTMAKHLMMVSAFQHALTGWGFHYHGTRSVGKAARYLRGLRRLPPEELADAKLANTIIKKISPSILAVARGMAATRKALQALEIENVHSINYMCMLANARRLATSYISAAGANLKYFETIALKNKYAKWRMLSSNPDYLIAYRVFGLAGRDMGGLPSRLKKEWGPKSLAWSLGSLSGAILSYFKTALLLSKRYSLRVTYKYGKPTKVHHQKAFMNMITLAERKSREHAHSARVATGSIPIQSRLYYQKARLLREGDLADKLRALEMFWKSSSFSQIAVMLARN